MYRFRLLLAAFTKKFQSFFISASSSNDYNDCNDYNDKLHILLQM